MQLPHLCWRMSSQAFYNVERKLEDCLCCLLRSPSFLSLFWGGRGNRSIAHLFAEGICLDLSFKNSFEVYKLPFSLFVVFLFIIFQFILLISYGFPTLFSCCFLPPPPSNLPHPLEFSN